MFQADWVLLGLQQFELKILGTDTNLCDWQPSIYSPSSIMKLFIYFSIYNLFIDHIMNSLSLYFFQEEVTISKLDRDPWEW